MIFGLILCDCLSGGEPIAAKFLPPYLAYGDQVTQMVRGEPAQLSSLFEGQQLIQAWLAGDLAFARVGHRASKAWCNMVLQELLDPVQMLLHHIATSKICQMKMTVNNLGIARL